jgi:hypothetical protein
MSCLIFACKPGIPKEVIQPAEMEKILHDIHIVDGYVTNIPTADSAKKVSSPLYKGIFKKYGVDSATHAKSMDYYYHRPDLLTKMYDNITARIEKEKVAEANKQQKSTTPEVAKELKN